MTEVGRIFRVGLLLALVLLILVTVVHPWRVAAKTLLLLPDMFPTSPIRPLTWITPPPRLEEYNYDFAVGHIDSDIYLPASSGQHGALILLLGAVGFPRRDPTLVRFADGLSRAGAVVMIPESSNLQQGEILPGEVDGLVQALDYLQGRPEVDPSRVGFLGFSVGGSVALLVAENERGREQVAFMNVFGAYYDALDFGRAVVSHQIEVNGRTEPWEPSELTVWVFFKQVIASLPNERDRDILRRAFLENEEAALRELGDLSPDGQLALELRRQLPRDRVDQIIASLPPSSLDYFQAISPSSRLSRFKSRLYLMHDYSDRYIPYVESRKLAADAPGETLRVYNEFDLFAHVTPDRPLEGPTFVREVVKLYRHAWLFCQEFL
jgi:acetyl esterase/lipase